MGFHHKNHMWLLPHFLAERCFLLWELRSNPVVVSFHTYICVWKRKEFSFQAFCILLFYLLLMMIKNNKHPILFLFFVKDMCNVTRTWIIYRILLLLFSLSHMKVFWKKSVPLWRKNIYLEPFNVIIFARLRSKNRTAIGKRHWAGESSSLNILQKMLVICKWNFDISSVWVCSRVEICYIWIHNNYTQYFISLTSNQ